MGKKKKNVVVNGVEVEVPEEVQDGKLEGVVDEEEQEGLDQEEIQDEKKEVLGDSTEIAFRLNWKEARTVLREADQSCSQSIDDFDQRKNIDQLKARFNSKERTEGLYQDIMNLHAEG